LCGLLVSMYVITLLRAHCHTLHTDALWRYGTAVRLAIPAPPFSPIRTSRSGSLRHGAKG
jgi:hypothetical protein